MHLLAKLDMPNFSDFTLDQEDRTTGLATALTFTLNGFYNHPHLDTHDATDFAFLLSIPIRKSDGHIVSQSLGYNCSDGQFVFPHHQALVDFNKLDGICTMVWDAKEYHHCTLPPQKSDQFTRLTMSLQISKRTCALFQILSDGKIKNLP